MALESVKMREARFRSAVAVLDAVRRSPGLTRTAMAAQLGLGSGSAAEITARLRELDLIDEDPAPAQGPGRPTTVLRSHPDGPLAVAVDLGQEGWRMRAVGLDGGSADGPDLGGRHASRDAGDVVAVLARELAELSGRLAGRVRAVGVAVPGPVTGNRLVAASTLGWGPVDLAPLVDGRDVPLVVGNDATLAGVAEARSGAAAGMTCALHLSVVVGVGGTLVVGGRPVTGATGTAGEYGHVPFGDPALQCPCGARGCWDLEVDGRALARHRGDPPPRDPLTYARAVLAAAAGGAAGHEPLDRVGAALGRGIAALVNAHDPDVVTLGGIGWPLREAAGGAFDEAYSAGLMGFRRAAPVPVVQAAYGDDGPLRGAVELALDRVITEEGLADWARHRVLVSA